MAQVPVVPLLDCRPHTSLVDPLRTGAVPDRTVEPARTLLALVAEADIHHTAVACSRTAAEGVGHTWEPRPAACYWAALRSYQRASRPLA